MADYETIRQQHVTSAGALLPELIERLDWPADRMAEHRRSELRRLVKVAKDTSPWHRQRLAGVDPAEVDESTLAELPAMTKNDLMEHWDEIVTDDRLSRRGVEDHLGALTSDAYLFDRYHALASGGSSGERGVAVWDWDGWTMWFLSAARHEIRARRLDPELGSGPAVSASVMAENPSHASSALLATFAGPGSVGQHRFPITQPITEIVAGLNALQPRYLTGYPSALRLVAEEAAAGRLRIAPRRVTVSGEPVLPEIRRAVEEAWGTPLINMYGATEGGCLAVSCGAGPWLHCQDDVVILEPVDEAGRAVPPGVCSDKVYVTNLVNHALPLVRYEITDQITMVDARCPCGGQQRLIEDPQGRLDDVFRYGGITVHPHVFRSILGRPEEIIEYQVRQSAGGAEVAVRTSGPVDLTGLESELVTGLRQVGLSEPSVSVSAVESLQRNAAGKLKRFLPLTGGDERI